MKKILSLLLAVCMLIGCVPLAAYAADGDAVAAFPYEGTDLKFIDVDGNTFGMLSPQDDGSYYYLDGDNVVIHIVPGMSKRTYVGFYYGAIADIDTLKENDVDVTVSESVTLDFTVSKDKCGYAWPVAPLKANESNNSWTTGKQYYLAIPAADKIPEVKTTVLAITNNTGMFKAEKAKLQDLNGVTNLVFSLSGTGYHNLIRGTYEDAVAIGDDPAKWIAGYENSGGKWEFVMPVKSTDTYIPIVAVSQSYYEKYKNGQNQLARAFYPRQLELDFDNATLVTGDFEMTKSLTVSNSSTLPVSTASLTTVGGPNSNGYQSTLALSMSNTNYTKAFIGTAVDAENSTETVALTNSSFSLKVRWIVTPGNPETTVSYLGKDTTIAFYNEDKAQWEEYTINPDESAETLTVKDSEKPVVTYTITFVNEDGTVLQSTQVEEGVKPTYTGETPVKAEDDSYTYEFKGWDPEITEATKEATYKAVFEQRAKTVSEFPYNGDKVKIIKEDGSEFGMMRAQDTTTAVLDGDNVVIHYVPNKTTYDGLYYGATTDGDAIVKNETAASDGSFDISLPKTKCGFAWPVVAIKKDGSGNAKEQYYLAIPAEDKLSPAGDDTPSGGSGGGEAAPDTPADSSVDLKVTNNVKMFKVIDAKLETTNGSTNLVVTLSASGYHYLYKGTFEEAKKVGYKTSKWIEGKLNKESKYVFSIPVDENESNIPIVSISQTYVDKYLAGENKIERAFFPRLFTLDTKKKTLTVDDYSETKTLKVSNKTDLDISRASLETVGGPNSNDYASTLTLSMKSGTYTMAYIGTAKKAASAKDTIAAGSGNTFALKVRWMATAGDLDSIESYIGEDETFAFYNADDKAWEEFTFNINDSKYTLTVTADEEAEAVPAEEVPGESVKTAFIDVKDSDWYDGYAEKAADNGLMAGYPAGTDADGNPVYEFRGSNKVTRAMFVTILSAIDTKLNGEKTAAASAGFDDVASGAWYEKAVDWAYANGITAGKGDSFGVNDNVSRQDMAVFMYGYAKSIGKVNGTPDTSVLDKYADASSIAPYAKEAVAWLVSSGLMTGRSETSIAPLAESTRAEISAFAVNCLEFLAK